MTGSISTEGALPGRWSSVGAEPGRTGSAIWRERDQVHFDLRRHGLPPIDGAVGLTSGVGVVLTVLGDLDMAGAPALRQAVVAEVTGGTRLLVLDLTAVDFLDSAGLGAVVGGLRRLRAHDGDLMVVCPEPRIRRVFESCDLDRVFVLYPDVGSVIAAAIAAGERTSV